MARKLSVFISYSRRDEDFVDGLKAALEPHCNPWVDKEEMTGKIAGEGWLSKIFQGISRCDVYVLVLSPDSLASAMVGVEYERARQRSKPIIPILWKECEIPVGLPQSSLIRFPQDFAATNHALLDTLKNQVYGGDRIIVNPYIGYSLLTLLALIGAEVAYTLHALPLFFIAFYSSTLLLLIKNLTYSFGDGTPNNPSGSISFFWGSIIRYLLLLFAGFLGVIIQNIGSQRAQAIELGLLLGLLTGVYYVCQLVLSGTYRTVIPHERVRTKLRQHGLSPRLSRVFGVAATCFGWTAGGIVGGALGGFLASVFKY